MRKILFSLSLFSVFNLFAAFQPFEGEPPMVTMTAEQKAKVASGQLVYLIDKQRGLIKEGSVAFRVNASQDKIWRVLADFNKYPDWSYKVGDAQIYKREGSDVMYIDFMTDRLSKHYYVRNRFPMKDWATWATDHSRSQDCVMDTVGFWRTLPVEGDANKTDVVQYGKIELTSLCSDGFFGIGGFDGYEMARTIHRNLKSRAESL